MDNLAPAYLFVGSRTILAQEALTFLQQQFCNNNGCGTCTVCTQLKEKQHHGALWIEPEKRYSLDDIEIIFKETTLALDNNQHRFFIITQADFLNASCANSLLKLVEEPPQGYHFIFLAERLSLVLPTIRSRCTQKNFSHQAGAQEVPTLVKQFMRLDADPIAFSKEVAACTMTEQECMVYLDELLAYWIAAYKRTLKSNNEQHQATALSMVNLFKDALKTPPAPGSAKLFWKNLFLQRN